jgi:bifunctional DNA-binding transcriptional regulator/antitoxin component of YhaV-PrlF toxin-antitoxin module
LTVPKAIADQYGIHPGDELEWIPAGEAIRVIRRERAEKPGVLTLEQRLKRFDHATKRQRRREALLKRSGVVLSAS